MSAANHTPAPRAPDAPVDVASLAASVLREVAAQLLGARCIRRQAAGDDHADRLVELAIAHADHWACHFDEQVRIIEQSDGR